MPQINAKYEITDKVTGAVVKAVDGIESDSDSLDSIKSSVSDAADKLSQLDKEYDLVGKTKQLAVAAGTISDSAIEKVSELECHYYDQCLCRH